MTEELPTLKDLNKYPFILEINNNIVRDFKSNSVSKGEYEIKTTTGIPVKDLKKMFIEWINELKLQKTRYELTTDKKYRLPETVLNEINLLMKIGNITKEDLK